jgi:hypothetical protein
VKKLTVLLVCYAIVYLLVGLFNSYNSPIDFNFNTYSSDEADKELKAWASSNSQSGTYLAKRINTNGLETYYIHVNDLPFHGFGLSGDGRSGLGIDIETVNFVFNSSKIIEIITENKKARYILLNGKRIDTLDIMVLNSK